MRKAKDLIREMTRRTILFPGAMGMPIRASQNQGSNFEHFIISDPKLNADTLARQLFSSAESENQIPRNEVESTSSDPIDHVIIQNFSTPQSCAKYFSKNGQRIENVYLIGTELAFSYMPIIRRFSPLAKLTYVYTENEASQNARGSPSPSNKIHEANITCADSTMALSSGNLA